MITLTTNASVGETEFAADPEGPITTVVGVNISVLQAATLGSLQVILRYKDNGQDVVTKTYTILLTSLTNRVTDMFSALLCAGRAMTYQCIVTSLVGSTSYYLEILRSSASSMEG